MKSAIGITAATAVLSALLSWNIASAADQAPITVGPDTDRHQMAFEKDAAAASLLPQHVQTAGRLVVGIEANAGYPDAIIKDGDNYGVSVDFANAIGKVLGVDVTIMPMPFSNIIPALGAKRIDYSSALFLDTAARRNVVDFLDIAYYLGDTFVLRKDSKITDLTFDNACGNTIAAIQGGAPVTRLKAASQTCTDGGKKPIDLKTFGDNSAALLAVKSGRADAAVFQAQQIRYIIKSDPENLKLGSENSTVKSGYFAAAADKGSDLMPALRAAALSLEESGKWKEILALYNYADGAPTRQVIENTAPVPTTVPVQ